MSEDARREAELARQLKAWPEHLRGAKQGNPLATLCAHCYGRHAPRVFAHGKLLGHGWGT